MAKSPGVISDIFLSIRNSQCRLSILRNANVPCLYFSNVPVDFKVVRCRLSNLRKRRVALSNLRVKGPFVIVWCMIFVGCGWKHEYLLPIVSAQEKCLIFGHCNRHELKGEVMRQIDV